MPEHPPESTPGSSEEADAQAYEPPAIEDLDSAEGPSVTAAGMSA